MRVERSTKALGAALLLTATAVVSAQRSQAATATKTRPLAKGEVLAVLVDPSVIEQTKTSKTPIKWPTTVNFQEISGIGMELAAKSEIAIETLECVGKPKPSCTMTLNGKPTKFTPKLPQSFTYEKITWVEQSLTVKPVFVVVSKKPPMTLIVAKPVTE